jgi:hypothetical protein
MPPIGIGQGMWAAQDESGAGDILSRAAPIVSPITLWWMVGAPGFEPATP